MQLNITYEVSEHIKACLKTGTGFIKHMEIDWLVSKYKIYFTASNNRMGGAFLTQNSVLTLLK